MKRISQQIKYHKNTKNLTKKYIKPNPLPFTPPDDSVYAPACSFPVAACGSPLFHFLWRFPLLRNTV